MYGRLRRPLFVPFGLTSLPTAHQRVIQKKWTSPSGVSRLASSAVSANPINASLSSPSFQPHLPSYHGPSETSLQSDSLEGYQTEFFTEQSGEKKVRVYRPSSWSPRGVSDEVVLSEDDFAFRLREQQEITNYASQQAELHEILCEAVKEREALLLPKDPQKVAVIRSMEQYEYFLYERPELLVIFFSARFSLQSKLLLPQFESLAATAGSKDQVLFLSVDCDIVPRAAYHADVDAVPTVVVMHNDDAYRVKIAPIDCTECDTIIARSQAAIQSFTPPPPGRKWPKGPSATHKNIPVDNLNVLRVGWIRPDEA